MEGQEPPTELTSDLALQGVLAGHENQLAREQELLLDGHRRLADAQARFGIAMNGRFPRTWSASSQTWTRSASCRRRWRTRHGGTG